MVDQQAYSPAQRSSVPDDLVLPFQAESAGAGGRVVRLGAVVDAILSQHAYPDSVSMLLGEAVALTAMLGASLKFEGTFILQTSTKGPVDLLVVDYRTPGELRGYAHFDRERIAALEAAGQASPAALLGHGHLAMTVDQGADSERYQGVVPLEGEDLNQAAYTYFRKSEQLPTFLRVAVARHYRAGEPGVDAGWAWRAGGLMIQNLPDEGGRATRDAALSEFDPDEEDWNRVRLLAETVQDHELVDPTLSSEDLLYRLFHEETVRTFRSRPLDVYCRCSKERIESLLNRFTSEDLSDMVEDGKIVVTCEFCSRSYAFDPGQFA